jgi:flagellar hook-basal body complex protein FliE
MNDVRGISPPLDVGGFSSALPAAPSPTGDSFTSLLQDALAKINEVQAQADVSVQSLLTGQSTNLHETMIALQKADVSFQLMLQVRNKIVGAYEEIMRMQL